MMLDLTKVILDKNDFFDGKYEGGKLVELKKVSF